MATCIHRIGFSARMAGYGMATWCAKDRATCCVYALILLGTLLPMAYDWLASRRRSDPH
jgi:hypothetical protein